MSDKSKDYLVEIVIAIAAAVIILSFVTPQLLNAAEAAQGCTLWESIVSDITGGTIETC